MRSNASRRMQSVSSHPLPIPFQKKRGILPLRCRGITYINLSYHYSRKRALHVCRRQTLHIATQCFTTDAIRLFTSLPPSFFKKSGVFCRSACPAIARRATADCRGITYINLSHPYSRKRALHVCRRQTLHIPTPPSVVYKFLPESAEAEHPFCGHDLSIQCASAIVALGIADKSNIPGTAQNFHLHRTIKKLYRDRTPFAR